MSKTTNGPVWRELYGQNTMGWRALTADLPGDVTLWVEFRPERTPRWAVDVARAGAWVAQRKDGGPTLATAKRRAMDIAMMAHLEAKR